ncbi:MAG TPA: hypothetical protein ENN39_08065 [Desulfonatronum sp.]|nr:hypothetical protein [Desulfonatronum sp.]
MIGFSPHYVEALPGLFAMMQKSRIVALEEPRAPGFQAMLSGDMPIDDYLLLVDSGFPEFATRMCQALRILWRQGTRIEQVDPYLDRLVTINECFADQKTPADVMAQRPKNTALCPYLHFSKILHSNYLFFAFSRLTH